MTINIISFNIPYPPNYGGIIDVFYKIKALSESGVKIILHTFEYGREHNKELDKYCVQVYYYKRKTGLKSQLSTLPYIVKSRENKKLLNNLLSNDAPILFEGLHTCFYLNNPQLKNRLKIVRTHNIEHHYYAGLSKTTKSITRKIFFSIEKYRLKIFENKLKYSDYIISLSQSDTDYFKNIYGNEKVFYVPIFHQNNEVNIKLSIDNPYLLFHGDLSVSENVNAANYLIENIAQKDDSFTLIIAGKDPDKSLINKINGLQNVHLHANPNFEEMQELIRSASMNILYAKHAAGVKIKLLNALFSGRFCLANDAITEGSGLESLCLKFPANNQKLLELIHDYYNISFDRNELSKRETLLNSLYNNKVNAEKIIDLIKRN